MEIPPAAFPRIQQRNGRNVAPQVALIPVRRVGWGGGGGVGLRGSLVSLCRRTLIFTNWSAAFFSFTETQVVQRGNEKPADGTAAFKRQTAGFRPGRRCSSIATRFALFKHPGRIRHISEANVATSGGRLHD